MVYCDQNFVMVQRKVSGLKGRWGTVDVFLHFQPLLFYFKSKQAQNLSLSHNKATLQYIQNIMQKHQNALQKEFHNRFKQVHFLPYMPHARGTLDMSMG